jgi:phage-related protein
VPVTTVVFYEENGEAPVLEWLDELKKRDNRGWGKCKALIEDLADYGFELRRPITDTVRDGIHELRARRGRVRYRMLHFYHGRNFAVLAHALQEQNGEVPDADIERAKRRMEKFRLNLAAHASEKEV